MIKKKISIAVASALIVATLPNLAFASSSNTGHDLASINQKSYSKAYRDARAKIDHLTYSLKKNYLGIKNQATWEIYIKEGKSLISKIPSSERSQRDALTAELNRAEALVKAVARINQVEKSMLPKSQGGYGNYIGIKNAETWRGYLNLAKTDLEKVDKSVFGNQYSELVSRMNKASDVVKRVEDQFNVEYNKVLNMFKDAKAANDKELAKKALVEAEKLGTCAKSDALERDIKSFINSGSGSSNEVNSIEKQVFDLVNKERVKAGLKPMILDSKISDVARIKSKDMADNNYFSHNSPTYGTPFDMMKKFGIKYGHAGENIAKGQPTAASVMEAWMNSPGHRANILSTNFGKIGIGYVKAGNTTYWTQMFTD
ncbi:CAP domain-containing protein [Clostridium sp.]|uniref:CAP domain-containing protein n=1 Tax=Clostridium sp. TaxID=1506 RepID=UPI003FA5FDD4